MHINTTKMFSRFFILLAASLSLLACNSSNSRGYPQVVQPPPFDYIDGEELRSRMHQLAYELQKLDMALADEYDLSPNLQQKVINNLRNIERIAEYLQTGDFSTRHPFLQDDMERFLINVRRAKIDASGDSPRYYMTGRISGGCVSCHRKVN